MRTFGFPDLWFIVQAAQWTIALSLIAFVGGAIGGLVIALARTSERPVPTALSSAFIQSRDFCEMKSGTKHGMTMPPLAPTRSSTSSGTLRG